MSLLGSLLRVALLLVTSYIGRMSSEQHAIQTGRPAQHPWAKWLTVGKQQVLVKGVDFDCEPYSMAIQLRRKASSLGLKVSISISGNEVSVLCQQ